MTAREQEEAVLQIMEPYIRHYCRGKWTAIEMEDRVSEARFVFLQAMRQRDTPEEEMWALFRRSMQAHMRPINRLESWHRYRCRSMDAPLRTRKGEDGNTLHDLLRDEQIDVLALVAEKMDDPLP